MYTFNNYTAHYIFSLFFFLWKSCLSFWKSEINERIIAHSESLRLLSWFILFHLVLIYIISTNTLNTKISLAEAFATFNSSKRGWKPLLWSLIDFVRFKMITKGKTYKNTNTFKCLCRRRRKESVFFSTQKNNLYKMDNSLKSLGRKNT